MTNTHKRDEWGYVEMDCDCEECYYYRLSYDLDTTPEWLYDTPGFAVVKGEGNLLDTKQAIYDEELERLAGDATWKGSGVIRLANIRVGVSYPMYGEPGEVFLFSR